MMLRSMLTQITSWVHLPPFSLAKGVMEILKRKRLKKLKVKVVNKKNSRGKTVTTRQRKRLKYP